MQTISTDIYALVQCNEAKIAYLEHKYVNKPSKKITKKKMKEQHVSVDNIIPIQDKDIDYFQYFILILSNGTYPIIKMTKENYLTFAILNCFHTDDKKITFEDFTLTGKYAQKSGNTFQFGEL
jgi:hypothetical protein